MARAVALLGLLLAACTTRPIGGQEHDRGHQTGSTSLSCAPAAGETYYYAALDDFYPHHSLHPNTISEAFFALNAERTELRYLLKIDGLSLKPRMDDRTAPDDIIGIHLSLYIPAGDALLRRRPVS